MVKLRDDHDTSLGANNFISLKTKKLKMIVLILEFFSG
jgi:hypothetical protein